MNLKIIRELIYSIIYESGAWPWPSRDQVFRASLIVLERSKNVRPAHIKPFLFNINFIKIDFKLKNILALNC
jgi:hypothetical protein